MLQVLLMVVLFVFITYAFGLLYVFIGNYVSKEIQYNVGWNGFMIFGAFGVPFHEFTHWLMCKIFFHHVTEVSLFRPKKGKENHILGFVKHEYKKTPYREMGNFFIGAAPMMLGTGLIITVFALLYPGAFSILEPLGLTVMGLKDMLMNSVKFLAYIFSVSNLLDWKFLVFLFFLIAISAHIDMSWVDIKSSLHGVIFFIILATIISIYAGACCNLSVLATADTLLLINIYYIYFLTIGALINLIIGTFFLLLKKFRGLH